jgi:hypothetical protein
MMLMIQNFGSKPKISCNTITERVITNGFLYLISVSGFIASRSILACSTLAGLLLVSLQIPLR